MAHSSRSLKNEISVKDLASMCIELCNSNSKIIYKPLPIDDPKRRKPCIKKAWNLMKWAPTVDIKDGLTISASYFRKKLDLC